MTLPLARSRVFTPWLAAAGLAVITVHSPLSPWLHHASAQVPDPAPSVATAAPTAAPDASPSAADSKLATDMVENRMEQPQFAPPGTFYLLKYVSARTDDGVEGFLPGEEVKLVDVNRDRQTLTVTNGRAQVEVPPIDLTNDRKVAAAARAKDQASQAQIVAYQQAQQAAYNKYQQQLSDRAAEAKQKEMEVKTELAEAQRDAAKERKEEEQATRNASAPVVNNPGYGYYDNGGDGFGTAYGYLAGNVATSNVNVSRPAAPAAPAARPPGNVAMPAPAPPAPPVRR